MASRALATILLLAGLVLAAGPFAATPARATGTALANKLICLDPGHGGSESGGVYTKNGRNGWTLREKEINLDVATALKVRLEGEGAIVRMTRTSDATVSLQQRVDICNDPGDVGGRLPDIVVSLHTNSTYASRWDGSNTLIYDSNDAALAQAIHPVMYSGLKASWSGRFSDYGIDGGDWFIPKYSNPPAVILEPVFMSNDAEASALRAEASVTGSRRAQIVEVEFQGILAFFAVSVAQ